MLIDLIELIDKVPDFYTLSQREQVKYICFIVAQNNDNSPFTLQDIRNQFKDFDLGIPSHLTEEFDKLSKGKIPFLVKKLSSYVMHPSAYSGYTSNFFLFEKPESSKANTTLLSRYDFHPQIKKVSFSQFQDGYYKEAIQNALVEVINQVKIKSGHPKSTNGRDLDGDDLMNRVFGCDNQIPVISFNPLKTNLDKAEQRGIMNLFKGIVGIRDRKAHSNFLQNDPFKTIEYLSLASLLLRLLDEYHEYIE